MEWKPIDTAPKDGTVIRLKGYQMNQPYDPSNKTSVFVNRSPVDIPREVEGSFHSVTPEGATQPNNYCRNPYGWTFIPEFWRAL